MLISKVARIPYVVRHPDTKRYAGKTIDALVSAVDMAPTLLSLAGQETPPRWRDERLAPCRRRGQLDSQRGLHRNVGLRRDPQRQWHYMRKVGPEPYPSAGRSPAPLRSRRRPEETRNVAQEHPEWLPSSMPCSWRASRDGGRASRYREEELRREHRQTGV